MTIVYGLCGLVCTLGSAAEVDYRKGAVEALQAGKLADVNRLCNKWALIEPGSEWPRIILGRALLRAGKTDHAVEQFELAIEANPLSPAPRCEMGRLFLEAGKPDASDKEFDEALRVDPKCLPAQLGKARVTLARGESQNALSAARQTLRSNASSAQARALIADCLLALGKTDEALVESARAVEVAPDDADLWYGLASASELAGRAEEAQRAWTRFLDLEPKGERSERVKSGCVVLRVQALRPSLARVARSPALSPDGKHVAFTVYQRGVFRASILGDDEPTLIAACPKDWNQRHVVWSPDGASLAYSEFTVGPPKVYRVSRVPAMPGHEPQSIDFPEQQFPSSPRWSPTGEEILSDDTTLGRLCLLNPSTGAHRIVRVADKSGRRLHTGQGDYLPGGKELVVEGTVRIGAERMRVMYRVAADTGAIVGKLFDHGQPRFYHPVVSEDGTAVAGVLVGRPSYLAVASASRPSHPVQLCEVYYLKPSWHPEGSKLVACAIQRGQRRLSLTRLGGLDRRPLCVTATPEDARLLVTVANQSEAIQQVALRWEAFDKMSLRIGVGEPEDGPLHVKSGEKADWSVELDPAIAVETRTVKIRALNRKGQGAVTLADWQE